MLWTKVSATLPKNTKGRNEAEKFLKAAYGLSKMLETPAIDVRLAGVEKRPDATVGDLLTSGEVVQPALRYAETPAEREVYSQLYLSW